MVLQPSVLTTGWAPPPMRLVYPTDCAPMNKWTGAMAAAGLDPSDGTPLALNIPYDVIPPAMAALVPSNWPNPHTETDLVAWHIEVWTNDSITDQQMVPALRRILATSVSAKCLPSLCPEIRWGGDADVSGLGMIISYYAEASLAAIFAVILVLGGIGRAARLGSRAMGALPRKLHPQFVHGAFLESAQSFLYAMLLFAIGMNLATIYRTTSAVRHPDEPAPLYGLQGSIYMSAFSILPAILLQSAARNKDLGKNFLRQTLWLLVIVFTITLHIIVIPIANRLQELVQYFDILTQSDLRDISEPFFNSHLQDVLWALACVDVEGLGNALENSYHVVRAFLCVNGLWWLCYTIWLFLSRGPGVPRAVRARVSEWSSSKPRRWETYLRLLNGAAACALMWAMLALFHRYRDDIADKAGDSNQDSQWSFGQVLALATWASVVLDLVRIIKDGPEQDQIEESSSRKTGSEVLEPSGREEHGPGPLVRPLSA